MHDTGGIIFYCLTCQICKKFKRQLSNLEPVTLRHNFFFSLINRGVNSIYGDLKSLGKSQAKKQDEIFGKEKSGVANP